MPRKGCAAAPCLVVGSRALRALSRRKAALQALAIDGDLAEVQPPERAHLVPLHPLAQQRGCSRVGQRQPEGLLVDQRLRLLVQTAAHALVVGGASGADQLVQAVVAKAREVGPRLYRRAGKLRAKEVVRVAVVACPTHEQQVMLASLGPADQLAPLDDLDLGLDADLGKVSLEHLRTQVRVWVEQTARGAGPDRRGEAVCQPALASSALAFFRSNG